MSSSEALLQVRHLAAAWDGVPVLHDVSFEVRPGEFLVLLGPNGSGKTTLLRCLAGFEAITGGRIVLAGRDLAGVPPHRRGVGLMFQDAALFPHRTVAENIAYAPLLQRRPLDEVTAEVDRVARLLHLEGFEDRRPETLSGGERQRVALARTLAARPRLVLLDEPFASIDAELKAELRTEFRRVLRADGIAAVHVTHDREEGLFLGDRVGLLFDGLLARPESPARVFEHPASARSARFLGYNVFGAEGDRIAVRPEDLRLVTIEGARLTGEVIAVGSIGPGELVVLRTDAGERVELRRPVGEPALRTGDRVGLSWTRHVAAPEEPS